MGDNQRTERFRRVSQIEEFIVARYQIEGVGGLQLLSRGQAKIDVLVDPRGVDRQRQSSLKEETVLLQLLESIPGLKTQSSIHLETVFLPDNQFSCSGTQHPEDRDLQLSRHIKTELCRGEGEGRLTVKLCPEDVVEKIGSHTSGDDDLKTARFRYRRSRINRNRSGDGVRVLCPIGIGNFHRLALCGRGD